MKRLKRTLALIGAIVLAGLYLVTFFLGITGNEATSGLLMACVVCTVLIPVLLYAMLLVGRALGKRQEPENKAREPQGETPPRHNH